MTAPPPSNLDRAESTTITLGRYSRTVHSDLKQLLSACPDAFGVFVAAERRRQALISSEREAAAATSSSAFSSSSSSHPPAVNGQTKAQILWAFSQRFKDFIQRLQAADLDYNDPDLSAGFDSAPPARPQMSPLDKWTSASQEEQLEQLRSLRPGQIPPTYHNSHPKAPVLVPPPSFYDGLTLEDLEYQPSDLSDTETAPPSPGSGSSIDLGNSPTSSPTTLHMLNHPRASPKRAASESEAGLPMRRRATIIRSHSDDARSHAPPLAKHPRVDPDIPTTPPRRRTPQHTGATGLLKVFHLSPLRRSPSSGSKATHKTPKVERESLPPPSPFVIPAELSQPALSPFSDLTDSTSSETPSEAVAPGRPPRAVDIDVYNLGTPFIPPPVDETFLEVVPCNRYQGIMNSKGINYYVQWEVERLIQNSAELKWTDIEASDLDQLVGKPSDILPIVPHVLIAAADRKTMGSRTSTSSYSSAAPRPVPKTKARKHTEMDEEEESIRAQDLAGVGNESNNWPFGGNLVFAVSVHCDSSNPVRPLQVTPREEMDEDDNPYRHASPTKAGPIDSASNPFGLHAARKSKAFPYNFKFKLCPVEPPTKSTRLARRFGSRRVLTVRFAEVPREQRRKLFHMLLGRALVVFGRVFRMLFVAPDAEAGTAVQTNEVVPNSLTSLSEPGTVSFLQLLSEFNGLATKPKQAMAKWASRTQLLLSDSVPAVRVDPAKITAIDDLVCASTRDPSRPATIEILTDGCGLMSEDLARRISLHPSQSHLRVRPCTVQMRIGGAKGLLVVMSAKEQEQYPGMDVVLRDSMVKSFPDDRSKAYSDPSMCTLDLLRVDGLKVGTSLSSEPIIVMEHCGVPSELLVTMFGECIESIRRGFLPRPREDLGEGEQEMRNRLISVAYRNGVGFERKKREILAEGRSTKVAGLTRESKSSTETSEYSDSYGVADNSTMEEQLYHLLQAGFTPTPNGTAWGANKLRMVVTGLVDKAVNDFKISLDLSATAFCVPDTTGVLAPDEIFLSFSSEQPICPVTGRPIIYLEGDVLVYRSPCKLPTDVRKMRAVIKPELFHLRDCVVLSADTQRCTASPASFLGGGDYDGDTMTVIWDKALVEPFTNAPDELATPPPTFEADNFKKDIPSVHEVLDAVGEGSEATKMMNIQYFLMANMLDQQLTGIYSMLHDNSVYRRGLAHPATIRLAHMFCHVLDARKSGLTVEPERLSHDRLATPGDLMWRRHKKKRGKDVLSQERGNVYPVAREDDKQFIMDMIMAYGEMKKTEMLADFPDPNTLRSCEMDFIGLSPNYSSMVEWAKRDMEAGHSDQQLPRLLNNLRMHASVCVETWRYICSPGGGAASGPVIELYRRFHEAQVGGLDSPARAAAPKRGRGKDRPSSAEIAARVRDLAAIWRALPDPAELERALPFGLLGALPEIKLACLLEVEPGPRNSHYIKIAFDLDLVTLCAMKAKSLGPTRTLPLYQVDRQRPAWTHTDAF